MSAAETIAKAIEKLNALSADSVTGDRWRSFHGASDRALVEGTDPAGRVRLIVAEHLDYADADLIVALHRTIDAQLAILRGGLAFTLNHDGDLWDSDIDALATAILGGAE